MDTYTIITEVDELEKGIGREMLQKYPGGQWITMNGRHVYIMKDGNLARETDPRTTKGGDIRDKAARLYDADVKGIQTGDLFRYGKQTVTVKKVGRSLVHIEDSQGRIATVPKKNFAAKAVEISPDAAKQAGQEQPSAQGGQQQPPGPAPVQAQPQAGQEQNVPATQQSKQADTPQKGFKFRGEDGGTWRVVQADVENDDYIIEPAVNTSKMTAQQKRVFKNTKWKHVTLADITRARQAEGEFNAKQAQMAQELMDDSQQEPPQPRELTPEQVAQIYTRSDQPPQQQQPPNPLNMERGYVTNSSAQSQPQATPGGQKPQGYTPRSVTRGGDVLSGEGSTDRLQEIYQEWSKHGSTYFDMVFPQYWWNIESASGSGFGDTAQKHTARVLNGKDGQPAAVGLAWVDEDGGGDAMYIQYCEVAPQHRADSKNKKKREKGLGARMIAEYVQESIDRGFGGKIRLTSLSRQATQDFYKHLGFKNEPEGGLNYTLDEAGAQKLLEQVQKAYGTTSLKKALDESIPEDTPSYAGGEWQARLEQLEDKLEGLIAGDVGGYVKGRMKSRGLNRKRPELPEAPDYPYNQERR